MELSKIDRWGGEKTIIFSNSIDKNKIRKQKKPIFNIGFVVLIIAIVLFAVINYLPWMHIQYKSSSDSDFIKKEIYKDFKENKIDNKTLIQDFFNSENSTMYLGLNKNDFSLLPQISNLSSIILVLLSFIFIFIEILDRKINFSYDKLLIFQTIEISMMTIVFLYIIYTLIGFLGANILSFTNINILGTIFSQYTIIFTAPIVITSISAASIKICFTVIKSNYSEMFKLSNLKKWFIKKK